VANPNSILILTLTLTRGLILDNAEVVPKCPWGRHFGTSDDMSGQFGTAAEVSHTIK